MSECALCQIDLPKVPVREENLDFCCHGCHTVYKILSSKNDLDGFENHPIFKQAVKSGLISNPALLEQLRKQQPKIAEEDKRKLYLEIEDMWCPSCAELVKLVLLQIKGVTQCVVDYSTDLAAIEYSPRYVSKESVIQAILDLGYSAEPLENRQGRDQQNRLNFRLIIAIFCTMNIMMFSYPLYTGYFHESDQELAHIFSKLSFVGALPILFYCMKPIWKRFIHSVRFALFGMETLVVMGVSTAFALSCWDLLKGGTHVYFDSMSAIVTFVLLGKSIESKAKFSAKETTFRLHRALPRKGRKLQENGESDFVPLKEVQVGDTLIALMGEKIVLDGVVVKGEGACDESCITGESIPVPKSLEKELIAGSIVSSGSLHYRVARTADDSALQKIIELIEQQMGHKTLYTRAVDKIIPYFVPLVVILASLAGTFSFLIGNGIEESVLRTITTLLISCPCAIGIAAPLAESLTMHALAQKGALVRNRGALQVLGKEKVFIFDKTGTITEGRFTVHTDLHKLSLQDQSLLWTLASTSNHPISSAIAQELAKEEIQNSHEAFIVEEIAGKGLIYRKENDFALLGSHQLLSDHAISPPFIKFDQELKSVVYFVNTQKQCFPIHLGDAIRPEAHTLLKDLKNCRRVLLSGDKNESVDSVAQKCQFDEWYGEQSPLDKREKVLKIRQNANNVAMVGDGINDAPALTNADISFSVVSATDISIQVSDILLTTDKISVIHQVRKIGRLGQRIVYQNLFWAFFYNCIGIGLAITGYLNPLFAAVAMICSSVFVVLNSLRLKYYKST